MDKFLKSYIKILVIKSDLLKTSIIHRSPKQIFAYRCPPLLFISIHRVQMFHFSTFLNTNMLNSGNGCPHKLTMNQDDRPQHPLINHGGFFVHAKNTRQESNGAILQSVFYCLLPSLSPCSALLRDCHVLAAVKNKPIVEDELLPESE
jgi:hypothetical protein